MTTTELDHFRDKRECQCGNTKAKNNSLVWRINECGCVICNICEDLNFSRGSNKCQTCQIVIYKHKFRNLVFDDPLVDKEIHIRKQLLCIFNKSEKDFKSLNDYYDYEEMFEDIVHSLTNTNNPNDPERVATLKKIEQYKKENESNIKSNEKRRKNEEKIYKEQMLKIDMCEQHVQKKFEEEDREVYQRKMAKVEVTDSDLDLASRIAVGAAQGEDPSQVVAKHEKEQEETTARLKRARIDDSDPDNPDRDPQNQNEASEPDQKISRTTFRAFRFVENERKLVLPADTKWIGWEYQKLELQMPGCISIKSREEIESIGYGRVFDKRTFDYLDKSSLYSLDVNYVMQRSINDAFNCL